jgi:hypothetical protein
MENTIKRPDFMSILSFIKPAFACNCEQHYDDMRPTWFCPVHGQVHGRPIDDLGFRADMIEYQRSER